MAARAPRKRTSAETMVEELEPLSTFDAALAAADDEAMGFDALKGLMDTLNAEDADSELAIPIYTRKTATSPWSLIDTWRGAIKAFNMDKLIAHIKDSFGDGDYKVTPRVKGRILKHIPISLGDPRPIATPPIATKAENNTDLLLAMMQMNNSSMMQMQQMQQQSQQATATLITGIITAIAPVAAALVSKPAPDTTGLIAQLATALKPEPVPQREGIKDIIESAAALKSLIGGESGAGGDDLMGLASKVLPGLVDVTKQAMAQKPATQPVPTVRSVASVPGSPAPRPQLRHIPLARPAMTPEQRIVAMIRPAVLQCAAQGTDPDETAALVVRLLHEKGVTDEQLFALGGRFVGDDPVSTLAEFGIDLRANREWGDAVIARMVERLAANLGGGDAVAARGDGDAGDAG